jgi:hypothetical protein
MRFASYVLAALIIALALVIAVGASRTQAQESTASWAFASQDPLFDTRIAEAFAALMDLDAAGAAGDVTLEYGVEGVAFAAGPDDAPLLLQAAGVMDTDGTLLLAEERPCAVWASNDDLAPVAEALGAELVGALAELGLTASDCTVADDATAADLLVWAEGEQPEDFDPFAEGDEGFLGAAPAEGETPDEGEDEGDGKAPGSPDPAVGGFGVFDDSSGVIPAWILAAAVLAAVLAAARLATGRFGR